MTETHYAQDALLYKKNKLRKKLKQKKKKKVWDVSRKCKN